MQADFAHGVGVEHPIIHAPVGGANTMARIAARTLPA
jgi:hypothetical protein